VGALEGFDIADGTAVVFTAAAVLAGSAVSYLNCDSTLLVAGAGVD